MTDFSEHNLETESHSRLETPTRARVRLSHLSKEQQRTAGGAPRRRPTSNHTQDLVAYRSNETETWRPRSASPSHDEPQSEDDHAPLDLLTLDPQSFSALTIPNVGQLNQLPIKCTTAVQRSVQYYTEVYARYIQQRPQFAGHGTDWDLLHEIVPFTLSDPMVLSSTVALMELVQNREKGSTSGLSKVVVHHASNTIHQLQTKLASPQTATGDDVLLAILNLAAMEYHESNFERVSMHMQALTRIVELKGGVDELGFDGYLKHTVLAYYELWAQSRAMQPRSQKTTIKYPSHPFSAELCKQISALPDGFHEPILERQLCSLVIQAIHLALNSRIRSVSDEEVPLYTPESPSTAGILCTVLLKAPELSVFERIVCLGVIACIIHFDRSKIRYRVYKPYLQVQSQILLGLGIAMKTKHKSQQTLWVWAACLLVAQTPSGSLTSRLGHEVLSSVAADISWPQRVEMCWGLFWDELCQEELLSKLKVELEPSPEFTDSGVVNDYDLGTADGDPRGDN